MNLRLALRASLLAAISIASSSLAYAQTATRTWVSGVGDDVNPCSRTAPCKTFAGANLKTAKGGEISVLDPGGFGAITITKSITIDGTGTMASILVSVVNGIIINITDRADTAKSVRIRGLSLNGLSTGLQGIKVIAASKVFVEDTVIDGFADGIGVAASGGTRVFVKDTTIRNNSGAGISVASGSQVILSNVAVVFNGTGLAAAPGGAIISFKNNVIHGNGTDGNPTSSDVLK
jgi:hypothetical protein